MSLFQKLMANLMGSDESKVGQGKGFNHRVDSYGINFYLDTSTFEALSLGQGDLKARVQLIVLRMLEEQNLATPFPNGYAVSAETITQIDSEQSELLELEPTYPGRFTSHIQGHTDKTTFRISMLAEFEGREMKFERRGPYLILANEQQFMLSPESLLALTFHEAHENLEPQDKTSSANLTLISQLQAAVQQGMPLDLHHFDEAGLQVQQAEDISVVATMLPDKSLSLRPSLGDGSSPEKLQNRWGQVDTESNSGAMRVDNRIVLLDEQKMAGISEIMGNRRIPPEQVEDFFRTPSAFLDASLVDLDMGFSMRVRGIGKLVHMDFDAPDAQKTQWFERSNNPLPPEILTGILKSEEEVDTFEDRYHAAAAQGAEAISAGDELVDISQPELVTSTLNDVRNKLANPVSEHDYKGPEKEEKAQVGIQISDAEDPEDRLIEKLENAYEYAEPNWSAYAREPYPHQREGIKWVLRLLWQALADSPENPERIQGGLLADDMGLGKTYIILVAIAEYLFHQKAIGQTQKPILVVAPLSLIENWEHEVAATFKQQPFRDIKALQANRDLKEFRRKGAQRESIQLSAALDESGEMNEDSIRYALEVGPNAGTKRLDMDARLVLTTYQVLRDYQFSLCQIDWGMVVFDEAQNLKNPNTQVTRAAKALKADLRILATGTPVENSLGDFWCLMDTAQPGLLGNWGYFRDRWVSPIAQVDNEQRDQVRLEVGQDLRHSVGNFMLRRTKEETLDALPSKHIHAGQPGLKHDEADFKPLGRVMRDTQLTRYNAALDDYATAKHDENAGPHALSTLLQLRNISLHPRLEEGFLGLSQEQGNYRKLMHDSVKLETLLDTLDAIHSRGDKVIIFLTNKNLQQLLKLWLDSIYKINIHIINGDTAAVRKGEDLTRRDMITDFEAIEGFNIILMSPIAAGVGLTVTGANHVIHLERHWNPAKEAQATDRIYRIGQQKDVHVHLPAALHPEHDSFDQHLDRLLASKLLLKDAVVTSEVVSEIELLSNMGLKV